MHTKSRYTCGASLIVVGVVCCVVATAAVMTDMPVKKRSGAELAYVPPPKHSAGNLVVSMESRFTERDLNTPGPIGDTYVDAMQLALVRLPNLATTPTVSGLAAISQFPVLLTLLVHPVKIDYHIEVPKEMPPSSNSICSRTRSCSRPSFKRICRRQPKTELKNRMSTTRASRIWQAARALWKLRTCNSSRLL